MLLLKLCFFIIVVCSSTNAQGAGPSDDDMERHINRSAYHPRYFHRAAVASFTPPFWYMKKPHVNSECPFGGQDFVMGNACRIRMTRLPKKGSFCFFLWPQHIRCPAGLIDPHPDRFRICCRKGDPLETLEIPETKKFYLYTYHYGCQHFKNFYVTQNGDHCFYAPYTAPPVIQEVTLWFPRSPKVTCQNKMGAASIYGRQFFGCLQPLNIFSLPEGDYCYLSTTLCPSAKSTYYKNSGFYYCCVKGNSSGSTRNETWPDAINIVGIYAKNCPVFKNFIKVVHYCRRNMCIDSPIYARRSHQPSVSHPCIYKRVVRNTPNKLLWPSGQYSIPQSLSGCSKTFERSSLVHSLTDSNGQFSHSQAIHLAGNYIVGKSFLEWSFCSKSDNTRNNPLPPGTYCLLQVGSRCPPNFSTGNLTLHKNDSVVDGESGFLKPNITYKSDWLTYKFCCRDDSDTKLAIFLPTSKSFYLFKYGESCQHVADMKESSEFVCFTSPSPLNVNSSGIIVAKFILGSVPITFGFKKCEIQLNLCYYEPHESDNGSDDVSTTPNPDPESKLNWPNRFAYGILKARGDSCPPYFDTGSVFAFKTLSFPSQKEAFFTRKSIYTTPGMQADLVLDVCSNTKKWIYPPCINWPPGKYCVIKHTVCPIGMFEEVFDVFDQMGPLLVHAPVPKSLVSGKPSLCCQNNLTNTDELNFPTQNNFILIKHPRTEYCPEVFGMEEHEFSINNSQTGKSNTLCYYMEPKFLHIDWPVGDYFMPPFSKTNSDADICPDDFNLVSKIHYAHQKDDIKIDLCSRYAKNTTKTNESWPDGSYCILTTSGVCPSTMNPTSQQQVIIPGYSRSNSTFELSFYLFCCRQTYSPVTFLPESETEFSIYASETCNDIPDMHLQETLVPTPFRANLDGPTLRPPFVNQSTLKLCHYSNEPPSTPDRCKCHQKATCYPHYSPPCHCNIGFIGDGQTFCERIPFDGGCHGKCHPNAVCVKRDNSVVNVKCVCKVGFTGNGFDCKPNCVTMQCPAHSHCIVDKSRPKCVCNRNLVIYKDRCHTDVIHEVAMHKDIHQFLTSNLKCFPLSSPIHQEHSNTYFFIFVEPKNITTCHEAKSHIGYINASELTNMNYSLEFKVPTLASTSIILNRKALRNQWSSANGLTLRNDSIPFSNAIIFYLDGSLPSQVSSNVSSSQHVGNKRISSVAIPVVGGLLVVMILGLIIVALMVFHYRGIPACITFTSKKNDPGRIHFVTNDDSLHIPEESR